MAKFAAEHGVTDKQLVGYAKEIEIILSARDQWGDKAGWEVGRLRILLYWNRIPWPSDPDAPLEYTPLELAP